MAKTLEDILKDYKFMPKSKNAFRKHRVWIDNVPDDMTAEGHRGYRKLISLLYDISDLVNERNSNTINRIIDELDFITTQNY